VIYRKRAYGYDLEQEIENVIPQLRLLYSLFLSPVKLPTRMEFLNYFKMAFLTTSTVDFI